MSLHVQYMEGKEFDRLLVSIILCAVLKRATAKRHAGQFELFVGGIKNVPNIKRVFLLLLCKTTVIKLSLFSACEEIGAETPLAATLLVFFVHFFLLVDNGPCRDCFLCYLSLRTDSNVLGRILKGRMGPKVEMGLIF